MTKEEEKQAKKAEKQAKRAQKRDARNAKIDEKKSKVQGKLAATKAVAQSKYDVKKAKYDALKSKVDGKIAYITQLITTLVGFYVMVVGLVDILMHQIEKIEVQIKKTLKLELKSIVSCGVNPGIPAFLKSTGSGIIIEVKKIDFLDIFKTDPNSVPGKLLYNDVISPLTNSSDFNTFLYGVIQDDGNTHSWKNILDVTFNSLGTNGNPNNSLTIKANYNYDNRKLTDLNNNYVNSLKLLNTSNIVTKVVDSAFGSISINRTKSQKQLEMEIKLDMMIDKLSEINEQTTVDDSYFTFDNDEIQDIQVKADNKKIGVIKIKTSETITGSVSEKSLSDLSHKMESSVTLEDKKNALKDSLDQMANENAANSKNASDNMSIKVNFIQTIINGLVKGIMGIVMTPKVILVFLINFKIVYGNDVEFSDPIDFLSKNKRLIRAIILVITTIIVKYLITLAIKEIGKLIFKAMIKIQEDKARNKTAQLLSLVGVSQEGLRKIK